MLRCKYWGLVMGTYSIIGYMENDKYYYTTTKELNFEERKQYYLEYNSIDKVKKWINSLNDDGNECLCVSDNILTAVKEKYPFTDLIFSFENNIWQNYICNYDINLYIQTYPDLENDLKEELLKNIESEQDLYLYLKNNNIKTIYDCDLKLIKLNNEGKMLKEDWFDYFYKSNHNLLILIYRIFGMLNYEKYDSIESIKNNINKTLILHTRYYTYQKLTAVKEDLDKSYQEYLAKD